MELNPTKTRFTLLFWALLLVATSCEKKDVSGPDIQFPLAVKAQAVTEKGNVRLFTYDGEVTDESVIARFIAGADGFEENFEIEPTDIITFPNDSTAKFESLPWTYRVQAEGMNKLAFRVPFTLGESDPPASQFILDHQRIAKTNITQAVPTATGFTYVGEVVQLASGSYDSFELPATVYKLSRWLGQGDTAAPYHSNSGVFSPFNEGFLETLRLRDTIAYQEGTLKFSK